MAPITFHNLQDFILSPSASVAEVRELLVKACGVVTSEYGRIRERRSIMPEIVEVMEGIGERMARSKATRNPLPKPTSASPQFLSDGLFETHISHSYHHNTTTSSTKIFSVGDVKFAANADTELILRLSSWRGRTTLSGEWRGEDYERGEMVEFLEDVRGVMLSLLR